MFFLVLDEPTLRPRIIILILPTDRPEIIRPTARTHKKSYFRLSIKIIMIFYSSIC